MRMMPELPGPRRPTTSRFPRRRLAPSPGINAGPIGRPPQPGPMMPSGPMTRPQPRMMSGPVSAPLSSKLPAGAEGYANGRVFPPPWGGGGGAGPIDPPVFAAPDEEGGGKPFLFTPPNTDTQRDDFVNADKMAPVAVSSDKRRMPFPMPTDRRQLY